MTIENDNENLNDADFLAKVRSLFNVDFSNMSPGAVAILGHVDNVLVVFTRGDENVPADKEMEFNHLHGLFQTFVLRIETDPNFLDEMHAWHMANGHVNKDDSDTEDDDDAEDAGDEIDLPSPSKPKYLN